MRISRDSEWCDSVGAWGVGCGEGRAGRAEDRNDAVTIDSKQRISRHGCARVQAAVVPYTQLTIETSPR